MVARGEQEDEVMDDRVGRVVAREARIRYMVAWLRAGGLQGKLSWLAVWFLVQYRLGWA